MKEQQQPEWTPNPSKYADRWESMWYDMMESRRFQIAQTHGWQAAEDYRYHSAERDYFLLWGKLPQHVIQDDCKKCDRKQAEQIQEWVDDHHARFFEEIEERCAEQIKAFTERRERMFRRAEAMPAYKAEEESRKALVDYAEKWIAQIRADMKPSANLGGDATTKRQQGDAPAQQGAKEADSTEADTHTVEE